MTKIIVSLLGILSATLSFAQIEYLDLTGLSNTSSISSRAIGSSGTTFSASMSSATGSSNPQVTSDGNISIEHDYMISPCINLTFSNAVELYVTDRTSGGGWLDPPDSLTFNSTNYTLVDPDNKITMSNSGGTAGFTPKTNITGYTNWSITFAAGSSFQICAMHSTHHGTGSANWAPFRIGVLSSLLPIQLTKFNVNPTKTGKQVKMYWETASEANNDFFTIECSIDGVHWQNIGTVEAQGNSSSPTTYQYLDNNPFSGTSYYRLKQTDIGGELWYSSIQPVQINKTNDFRVYPNPAVNSITISNVDGPIMVMDLFGTALNKSLEINQVDRTTYEIDISILPYGLYWIKTPTSAKKFSKTSE